MTRLNRVLLTLVGVLAIGVPALVRSPYALLYNPTNSAPRGWYALVPAHEIDSGDYIVADLRPGIAWWAAERGYMPVGVPLLKQVNVTEGAHVCTLDGALFVDDVAIANIRRQDAHGRALHPWAGCRALRVGELFLLNPHNDASFDSRYFGPVRVEAVRGRAIPLWTWNRS